MLLVTFIIVGLLLAVLQTTIFMLTPIWPASPDLYYILVAYLAYRIDILRGLCIIFPVTCILDVYSGTIIGMYPAICYSGYGLLKIISIKMPVRKSLYQIPLVAISYLVVNWLIYLFFNLFQPHTLAPWSTPMMLLKAGLIVLLAFPLFSFFEMINTRFHRKITSIKILHSRPGNQFRQRGKKLL
jgi:rod shape-determining protein MreD